MAPTKPDAVAKQKYPRPMKKRAEARIADRCRAKESAAIPAGRFMVPDVSWRADWRYPVWMSLRPRPWVIEGSTTANIVWNQWMAACPPVTSQRNARRSRPMPLNGARIASTRGRPVSPWKFGAPARITSCRSAWSASTSAVIASTIGTARGSTHGSWRPRAWIVVSSWWTSTVCCSRMIVAVGLKATRK